MFVYVSDVFMSLVWPVSLPQAIFEKKAFPDVWIMFILKIVRIVRITSIFAFGDLSKKRRAEKTLYFAVLARPELSRQANR